ncbi:kappaPI-stichotoxin-Shd2a-like [Pomacea canaliculata]|uniref:kappaPI-stichotoxin-Shd2a-like n=1 Tax=Pomacea canaliculata TaxID=400727 RepID=UPI000D73EB7B|nr:kappaPI-stichotoxin-Shd2a-like [Pomacea canaliculata]
MDHLNGTASIATPLLIHVERLPETSRLQLQTRRQDGRLAVFILLVAVTFVSAAVINEKPEYCSEPSVPGLCMAYFPRYFYNAATKKCEQFIYGGCGGNSNNFFTLTDCQSTCED